MKGTVSVALATYNGARFLEAQLESIAQQTRLPDQLVISDDASTDETLAVLEQFKAEAPFPVQILADGERRQFGRNFLNALSKCTGDYIAFCDQDDVWLPQKLERLSTALDERPDVSMVIHQVEVVNENLEPLGRELPNYFPVGDHRGLDLPYMNNPQGMRTMFRRNLARTWPTNPIAPSLYDYPAITHDELAWLFARSSGRILVVPDRLARYRQHQANVAGAPTLAPVASLVQVVSFQNRASAYEDASQRWSSYSSLLQDLTGIPPVPSQYAQATAQFQFRSRAYSMRAKLHYRPTSFGRRLKAFAKCLFFGCYTATKGRGLGPKALAKDLLLLVRPSS